MSESKKWVLVTGGLGYIGSHVTLELCLKGFNVIVIDKSSRDIQTNETRKNLNVELKARGCSSELHFIYKDLEKTSLHIPRKCDYIIHLAAYKSVPQSMRDPILYYHNNINSLLTVLKCARQWGNKPAFVFSSSATVYGQNTEPPLTETAPTSPSNPYGHSKLMCEQILRDAATGPNPVISSAVILRYFNPVGAHIALGETTTNQTSNLMPVLLQTLKKQRVCTEVFGFDYPTRDGTAIRDYIHVLDLADAHIAVCELDDLDPVEVINLGRGEGVTVLELIKTLEDVTGEKIPFRFSGRRSGDAVSCYTSCNWAKQRLGWEAIRDLKEICRSAAKAAEIQTID